MMNGSNNLMLMVIHGSYYIYNKNHPIERGEKDIGQLITH
jgi:hypothetical protein